MTDRTLRLSIQSLLLWVVMATATFSLVVSSGLSYYNQTYTYQAEFENRVATLAKLISRSASQSLLEDNPAYLEEKMQFVSAAENVLTVHVYKVIPATNDNDNPVESFASYNKEGQLLIASKENQLVQLENNPSFSEAEDYIEVSYKIVDAQSARPLGWVYLRASAASFNQSVYNSMVITFSVILALLLITFIVVFRLQKVVTRPIEALSQFLQQTSRQRDYSARANISTIPELASLSDAVNVMLARIQEYIQKQHEAEDQHRKLNASLEEIVSQRTIALKEANQELIQTLEKLHQFQRQIVQNEKMASLGDMVAGVAHEVNTPIGLGVTASTMMLDRLAVIAKDFENKTLKASAMRRFIDESNENLNIIYRNLNRAAELISSFKQVAVDQSSETSRTFCFAQLVNEILLSLQPRLKKLQHNINVECDPTLSVETKAGPINQILINLIMNSVIHGFEHIEKGQIDICAELITANKLRLVYRDNGSGIPTDIRKRIFDPFVTTKRGQGGSGLGMHLVYNLVTQALNGSISITSEVGNGVEFVIIFPVSRAKNA